MKLTVRRPSEILALDLARQRFEPKSTMESCGSIHPTRPPYEFELDTIRTKAAILRWVHHLCGKAWMDRDSLAEFIETVAEHQGINIHSNSAK